MSEIIYNFHFIIDISSFGKLSKFGAYDEEYESFMWLSGCQWERVVCASVRERERQMDRQTDPVREIQSNPSLGESWIKSDQLTATKLKFFPIKKLNDISIRADDYKSLCLRIIFKFLLCVFQTNRQWNHFQDWKWNSNNKVNRIILFFVCSQEEAKMGTK